MVSSDYCLHQVLCSLYLIAGRNLCCRRNNESSAAPRQEKDPLRIYLVPADCHNALQRDTAVQHTSGVFVVV